MFSYADTRSDHRYAAERGHLAPGCIMADAPQRQPSLALADKEGWTLGLLAKSMEVVRTYSLDKISIKYLDVPVANANLDGVDINGDLFCALRLQN